MLIVRDNIPTTRREDLQTGCELLWVELTLAPSNLLVGAYYNPPGSNCGTVVPSHTYEATSPPLTDIPQFCSLGTSTYTILTGAVVALLYPLFTLGMSQCATMSMTSTSNNSSLCLQD